VLQRSVRLTCRLLCLIASWVVFVAVDLQVFAYLTKGIHHDATICSAQHSKCSAQHQCATPKGTSISRSSDLGREMRCRWFRLSSYNSRGHICTCYIVLDNCMRMQYVSNIWSRMSDIAPACTLLYAGEQMRRSLLSLSVSFSLSRRCALSFPQSRSLAPLFPRSLAVRAPEITVGSDRVQERSCPSR